MQRGRFLTASAAAFVLSAAALAPGARAESGKTYDIYISNNFVGNDWRQQMLRSAAVAAKKPPLAGRVNLTINNVETTTQAQINSLNNIIREKPAAILVDAGSGDALNPTLERACAAGIVVVSFDQVVTAPCAYKVSSNFDTMSANQAAWMAKMLGGKGKVLMDRGLAGAPVSEQLENGFKAVLAKYPGISIVGTFNGNYALGPEQSGVANLLAANPDVDGILSQAYGTGAIKALQDAGHKLVPITAAAFNGTATTCLKVAVPCILGPNPPYLSAVALRLAVDVLDGKVPASKTVLVETPLLTTDPVDADYVGTVKPEKIEVGKSAFADLPPGLSLPISPDWVHITAAEAAGTQ